MKGGLALCGLYKRRLHFPGHSDEKLGQPAEEPNVEPSSLRQDPAEFCQQGRRIAYMSSVAQAWTHGATCKRRSLAHTR